MASNGSSSQCFGSVSVSPCAISNCHTMSQNILMRQVIGRQVDFDRKALTDVFFAQYFSNFRRKNRTTGRVIRFIHIGFAYQCQSREDSTLPAAYNHRRLARIRRVHAIRYCRRRDASMVSDSRPAPCLKPFIS